MSFDLTNKNIQDTFQNLLQKTGSEGKLFDLVGNEITDLTIGGTLTAHSYITSESIVNTSSGSTAFGNSSDDTHQFTGSVNISHSVFINSTNASDRAKLQIKTAGSEYGQLSSHNSRFYIGTDTDEETIAILQDKVGIQTQTPVSTLDITGDMKISSHITASGEISASDNIKGKNFLGKIGSFGVGVSNQPDPTIPSNNDIQLFVTRNGSTAQALIERVGNGELLLTAGASDVEVGTRNNYPLHLIHNNTDRVKIDAGGIDVIGHITASGNISGSSTSTLTLGGDITTNNTIVLPGDGGATHETIINAHNQRGMLKKQLNAVFWQVGQGTNQFEITDGARGNSTKGNVLLRTDGRDENDNKLFLVPDGAQLNIGGHITASGDISASGTGSFSDGRFSGFVGIGNGGSAKAPEALLHLQNTEDDKYLQRWTLNNIEGGIFGDASGDVLKIQVNSNDDLAFTTNATERVRIAKDGGTSFTSHITASGNISGSNIVVENIFTGNGAQGGIQLNSSDTVFSQAVRPSVNNSYTLGTPSFKWSELNVNHITASGEISSSTTIKALEFSANEDLGVSTVGYNIGGQPQLTTSDSNATLNFGINNSITKIKYGKINPAHEFAGNITASGNISASGDVFAFTGSFNYITASELDLDGQTLRIGGESFTKANIQTLKQGRTLKPLRIGKTRPDFEAEDGRFDGDITASGDILNTQTIQMTNLSSVINTFDTGSHKTCKYVLQVTSGSHIQSSEMLVMQNGSNAFNTEYAQINSGLNLVNFSSKVNGSNVELIGSSSFISCSVKLNRKLI